jgi:hypothetical protein
MGPRLVKNLRGWTSTPSVANKDLINDNFKNYGDEEESGVTYRRNAFQILRSSDA